MRAEFVVALMLAVTPAPAHAIIDFDHASPPVGSTVHDVRYIALWFRSEIEHGDIEVQLSGVRGSISLTPLSEDGHVISMKLPSPLPPGLYFVGWRDKDEGPFVHTYSFRVQ